MVADDRLVGGVGLKDVSLTDEVAELDVSIFQPEDWGEGFGTEAMLLALRYAFDELGLHRVWLTVSSFNERAIKLYEKLGVRQEGRARDHIRLVAGGGTSSTWGSCATSSVAEVS